MTVINAIKELLDAMIVEDDHELAASKARELADILDEEGCPAPMELIKTLKRAGKHYTEVIEEEEVDALDFDGNDEEEGFFDPEEIDFDL